MTIEMAACIIVILLRYLLYSRRERQPSDEMLVKILSGEKTKARKYIDHIYKAGRK